MFRKKLGHQQRHLRSQSCGEPGCSLQSHEAKSQGGERARYQGQACLKKREVQVLLRKDMQSAPVHLIMFYLSELMVLCPRRAAKSLSRPRTPSRNNNLDSYLFQHSDWPFETLRRNLRDSRGGLPQCPQMWVTISGWLQIGFSSPCSTMPQTQNTSSTPTYLVATWPSGRNL